jgi:hypothetical protein
VKKLLVFLLLFSYAGSSLGLSLDLFYCCGKLKRVSIIPAKESPCCCKKTGKSCCSHQLLTYSLQHDQEPSAFFSESCQKYFIAVFFAHSKWGSIKKVVPASPYPSRTDSSPPAPSLPRHLVLCCFRI